MMLFQRFSVAALLCSLPLLSSAQSGSTEDPDWSVLMQQQDASPDEIRALFEAHWEGRERVKGSGYKQVERWLHLMDGRTDNQGHALTSEQTWMPTDKLNNGERKADRWRGIGRSVVRPWTTSPPGITFAVSDA